MYAKLIICEDESDIRSDAVNRTHSLPELDQINQIVGTVHWQMTANNITTGKLIDLLVHMDKLGFRDTDN